MRLLAVSFFLGATFLGSDWIICILHIKKHIGLIGQGQFELELLARGLSVLLLVILPVALVF